MIGVINVPPDSHRDGGSISITNSFSRGVDYKFVNLVHPYLIFYIDRSSGLPKKAGQAPPAGTISIQLLDEFGDPPVEIFITVVKMPKDAAGCWSGRQHQPVFS